jgi:erythromycin esterase-like protein
MSRGAKDVTEATNIILSDVIRQSAHSLTGAAGDYDPLMKLIGDAHFVLLGEASHGTHEFYRERAQITKRLIKEKGFNVVAVEADWPDAYRVNRYVRGFDDDKDAADALGGFRRFPSWMMNESRATRTYAKRLRQNPRSFRLAGHSASRNPTHIRSHSPRSSSKR